MTSNLCGGTDEVTVVEVMVVELGVTAIRGLAADEASPCLVVVKERCVFIRVGSEPVLEPFFDFCEKLLLKLLCGYAFCNASCLLYTSDAADE